MTFPAFLVASPFVSSQNQYMNQLQKRPTTRSYQAPKWSCAAKSHPWGNGGLDNHLDFTGYDKREVEAEIAEAEKEFAEKMKKNPPRLSPWVVIMSADVIQKKKHLFEAFQKDGLTWDFTGLRFIRYDSRTLQEMFDKHVRNVWLVELANGDLVMCGDEDNPNMLMSFEHEDEVNRFIDHLQADGIENAKKKQLSVETVERIAESNGSLIGFITQTTFIAPGKFTNNIQQSR